MGYFEGLYLGLGPSYRPEIWNWRRYAHGISIAVGFGFLSASMPKISLIKVYHFYLKEHGEIWHFEGL
jgi:hypothetical protein